MRGFKWVHQMDFGRSLSTTIGRISTNAKGSCQPEKLQANHPNYAHAVSHNLGPPDDPVTSAACKREYQQYMDGFVIDLMAQQPQDSRD